MKNSLNMFFIVVIMIWIFVKVKEQIGVNMSTDNKETFDDENVDIFDDREAGDAATYDETSTEESVGDISSIPLDEYIHGSEEYYEDEPTGELEGSLMEEASDAYYEDEPTGQLDGEYVSESVEEADDITSDVKEPSSKKDKKKKKSDEKASKALKTVGVFSIVLAALGLAAIGVFTYYMVIAPYYDKNGESYELNYPILATDADADTDCKKLELMQTPTDASATDAEPEGEVE